MRLSHDPLKISASFDDPNLVSRAGLVPVMALAARADLMGLVREHVRITAKTGVIPEARVGCLVAGMAAGADLIDDMDLLRHDAMPGLVDGSGRCCQARRCRRAAGAGHAAAGWCG